MRTLLQVSTPSPNEVRINYCAWKKHLLYIRKYQILVQDMLSVNAHFDAFWLDRCLMSCFKQPSGSYIDLSILSRKDTPETRETPSSRASYGQLWMLTERWMPLSGFESTPTRQTSLVDRVHSGSLQPLRKNAFDINVVKVMVINCRTYRSCRLNHYD